MCSYVRVYKFYNGNPTPDLICKKVCDHINKQYKELALEDLRDVAETYLRCLADANAEDVDLILKTMLLKG